MRAFDVIVVGGGPAGAVSALTCSQLGLSVLLVEQGVSGRHKICGGVLTPDCVESINETLNTKIPLEVFSSPKTLGLYYVPPSGRKNSGCLEDYVLLNINRAAFDSWLLELAKRFGVQVWNKTKFLRFKKSKPIQVYVKKKGCVINIATRYLIGADGVYSTVRSQICGNEKVRVLKVLQEYCRAKGDFGNYFYVFFRENVSPTYSYVIPKDGLYLIGTAVPSGHRMPISACLSRFKAWLSEEFAFNKLIGGKKENWAIPYGSPADGSGDVILTGDAAGFCNAFSGEGIRLAIESGAAVGEAVKTAMSRNVSLNSVYSVAVGWIKNLVWKMHEFANHLSDQDREEFVKSELNRNPKYFSWRRQF